MKVIPTFALPIQFLIWIAKKVLAQSNLDLLLTKYYKKRLESQLKNRKIEKKNIYWLNWLNLLNYNYQLTRLSMQSLHLQSYYIFLSLYLFLHFYYYPFLLLFLYLFCLFITIFVSTLILNTKRYPAVLLTTPCLFVQWNNCQNKELKKR